MSEHGKSVHISAQKQRCECVAPNAKKLVREKFEVHKTEELKEF